MSLPTSRNTTYVAGTPPTVKAVDLNDLQDHLINIHKALGFRNESFRTSLIREEWLMTVAESAAGATLIADSWWNANTTANAALQTIVASSTYPASGVLITPGTANTNEARLSNRHGVWCPAGFGVMVLEFDFLPNTSLANITWDLGFSDTLTYPDDTASHTLRIRSIAGAAWHAITGVGGAATATSLTDAPATSTRQRFRIEYHGVNSPAGIADYAGAGAAAAKAVFFINGTRRAVVTATLPTAAMNLFFRGRCTGVASGTGSLGPLLLNASRYAGDTPMEGITGL